jgi:hypothetical protein
MKLINLRPKLVNFLHVEFLQINQYFRKDSQALM